MSEFVHELTELIEDLAKEADDPSDGELSAGWRRVQELGLMTIGLSQAAGGSGGELTDLMVAIRELARAGIRTPIVEASAAAFAVGVPKPDTFDTIAVNRIADNGSPTLTGDLGPIPFAPSAGRLVLVGDSGVAVVLLSQAGVTIEADPNIAGHPAGRVRLAGVAHEIVPARSGEVIERLALARSAALFGSARGAYDRTRHYATERIQFGAPLIKISAVSAALAQMSIQIGSTQSAIERAVTRYTDPDGASLARFSAIASARITAARMATLVARTAHQLHGAVGVTREYDLHRYTSSLWAWRDGDVSEQMWRTKLGATALAVDEVTLWDEISA